jgi:hypothetical protein
VLGAVAVAAVHGVAVLFMLTGSLLALRWPRVLWLHVPVSLAILGLYLTGSDCPLTTWELRLRQRAGEPGYTGGFIGHYVTDPLGFPIHATTTQLGIYVIAFVPNVVGYGLLVRRGLRKRSARRRAAVPPGHPVEASRRSRPRPPATPASERDR